MKGLKEIMLIAVAGILSLQAIAQNKPAWVTETKEQRQQRMQWWADARLGMFIQ